MSGLSSTLSIAKTAIYAQQSGLSVTGNNVANANNPNYSVQNAELTNRISSPYGGHLYGTGVDTAEILQNVNIFIETKLTNETSAKMAHEEAASYMKILEGYFSETSDTSLRNTLIDFWNSWHTLSNNSLGASERLAVLENGETLANRLNEADINLDNMVDDLNSELSSAIKKVNAITEQIAELNAQISAFEVQHSANDLKDQRNALVNELAEYMDINIIQKGNGTVLINTVQGQNLVIDKEYNTLRMEGDQVILQGSGTNEANVTDKLTRGKMAGWLEVRDAIIPDMQKELDVLTNELVWAVNYQHSQGAGLGYYTDEVTGEYQFSDSGMFSSLDYGDKIDYSQMFVMWLQDQTTAESEYAKTSMDMGVSEAGVSDWQVQAPVEGEYSYRLTVMEDGFIGKKEITETDGTALLTSQDGADMNAALAKALTDQTLYVDAGNKERTEIKIQDAGGNAEKSAASIAQTLSQVDGVEAYASEVTAGLDLSGITQAHNGDKLEFTLWVDGVESKQSFIVEGQASPPGNTDTTILQEQFEKALHDAVQAINDVNEDKDLTADGLSITSSSGRSVGIQDFEVVDNAGIDINSFANFIAGDTVTFTVDSSAIATSDATSTEVSILIPAGMDTSDQSAMSTLFYEKLRTALAGKPFELSHDPKTDTISLTVTNGSVLALSNEANPAGSNAEFAVTIKTDSDSSITSGASPFVVDGAANTVEFTPDTQTTDTLNFTGSTAPATLAETSVAAGNHAGVVVGTVSIFTEPGTAVYTDESGAGGLFDGNWGTSGSSIVTFGGDEGFSGFEVNEDISFKIDGHSISYQIAGTTPYELAIELANEIDGQLDEDYKVIQNGSYVSIVKSKDIDEPIEITDFSEVGNGDAILSISTGMGKGARDPENDRLMAGNTQKNSATSVTASDPGIIRWEKHTSDGLFTGQSGLIDLEEDGMVDGTVNIKENDDTTVSFTLSTGDLVAGNTLSVNTKTDGIPVPLDFTIYGNARQANEVYQFTVENGGQIGELASEEDGPIEIQWSTPTSSGSFKLPGTDPVRTPDVPIEVEVDGMKLRFTDGNLFDGDVFTITTDENGQPVSKNADGKPTGELMSDWHWTMDSFTESFNRQAQGITANATTDNRLSFAASEDYYTFADMEYSGLNGFDEENITIEVKDGSALNFPADDLKITRTDDGKWAINNTTTGKQPELLPEEGDDQGFGIDFNGDNLTDIYIKFADRVSGEGHLAFDLTKHDASDLNFAFSDDSGPHSGLAAAVGVNTFFNGTDAGSISVSDHIKDTDHIASGLINSATGEISQGDNTNAIALANVQNIEINMQQWSHARGTDASSTITTTSLDGYQIMMTGSLGILSSNINSSVTYSEALVNNLTDQRNSVSGVSLDEEMIQLMRYQHGFTAASKLLSTADEMLMSLINMR